MTDGDRAFEEALAYLCEPLRRSDEIADARAIVLKHVADLKARLKEAERSCEEWETLCSGLKWRIEAIDKAYLEAEREAFEAGYWYAWKQCNGNVSDANSDAWAEYQRERAEGEE